MPDQTRVLGRTGLKVSLLGLGAGGNSRLGLSYGLSEDHAADVVRAALDMGITMIDTARVYGTERSVGRAIKGRRAGLTISSKSTYLDPSGELLRAADFSDSLDSSLSDLGVETIDIYFIHGLRPAWYDAARERFLPVLERARRDGKVRFIGITEAFETDTRHETLQHAVHDPEWDVLMVGHNIINQSARDRVFAHTQPGGTGTLGMFAVRRGLIDEDLLRTLLRRLSETGQIDPELGEQASLMDTLGLSGVCETLSEAAYRFAAYTPGMDCVLSGTSSPAHLRANLEAVARGPLPEAALRRLNLLFGRVDSVSAQVR